MPEAIKPPKSNPNSGIFRALGILLSFLFLGGLAYWSLQKSHSYGFSGAKSMQGIVDMSNFDGKYKIIYFGFLSCPDVCPNTLQLVAQAIEKLQDSSEVVLLFVSLDPERDSLSDIDSYAKHFYARSYGLLFELDELEKIKKTYGVHSRKIEQKDSALDYTIEHSSIVYLFDKRGRLIEEVRNLAQLDTSLQNLITRH